MTTRPIDNTQPTLRLVRPAGVEPARSPVVRAQRVADKVEFSGRVDRAGSSIEPKPEAAIARAARTAALVAGVVRERPVSEPVSEPVAAPAKPTPAEPAPAEPAGTHEPRITRARFTPTSAAIKFYRTPAEQAEAFTAARSIDVHA